MKYLRDFMEHFRERQAFTIRDARIFLKAKKISEGYLHFMIQYCLKRKGLKKITKGTYTFGDDSIVTGFAFKPFYYGLHYALSLLGFWGQASNPVIITPKKVRSGIRTSMGGNIIVRKISPGMFFGFETTQTSGGIWVPVSTPEKTLLDFFYFRQKIPSEAMQKLIKKADTPELRKMLKKTPKWVQKRVQKILTENPAYSRPIK